MYKETLALIPARAGSKSIQLKNIQNFEGIPLLAHSIHTALELDLGFTFLSTENRVIADIARYYGASVPYLRSNELAGDFVRDYEVIVDALRSLREREIFNATFVLLLRPTYPKRNALSIRESLSDFFLAEDFCAGRSLTLARETPFKMWRMDDRGSLSRVTGTISDDNHNSPRQLLPTVYWQDGNFDIFRASCVLGNCIHENSPSIRGYRSPDNRVGDIDYKEEFIDYIAETQVSSNRFLGSFTDKRVSS